MNGVNYHIIRIVTENRKKRSFKHVHSDQVPKSQTARRGTLSAPRGDLSRTNSVYLWNVSTNQYVLGKKKTMIIIVPVLGLKMVIAYSQSSKSNS